MITHNIQEELVITLPKEFDMKANFDYLTREKNECMYEVDNDLLTRVIVIGDTGFLVQLRVIANQEMVVGFLGDARPTKDWQRQEIVQYIRAWFDLDNDIAPFYELAQTDSLLKTPVKNFYGLRLLGIPDLFEALCWGVLGQQINLAFAYTLKKQFVEAFGDCIEWGGKKYWIFPTYERIAQLTPSDLSSIKMTVKKKRIYHWHRKVDGKW